MPRRFETFNPGEYYHICNRGNNRQAIFFEAENYNFFLFRIKRYLIPVLDIIAYCLMPTHYHLLVRVKSQNFHQTSEVFKTSDVSSMVSYAMQKLGISYTKAINKRFDRVGALFQGPFQAIWVAKTAYLYGLCAYIHANPVKDGLVAHPEDWPYSNYLEWIGMRGGTLVDRQFIQEMFPDRNEYTAYVKDYLNTLALPDDLGYLQE
jgi:REP element-mobilizing transposase RayT